MKKTAEELQEMFGDEAGREVYKAAAAIAAHDPRPTLEQIDAAFYEILSPVVELLRKDGLSSREALNRAASLTPRWYALKRAAWNERHGNETRDAGAYLQEARDVVKRLVADAQASVRKGAMTNEAALRDVVASDAKPPWMW